MNTEPQFVYVAIYQHSNGEDIGIYHSEEGAWKWADEIAQTYWNDWYDDEPMPTEKVGEAYFNKMDDISGDEWFVVERRQVEP